MNPRSFYSSILRYSGIACLLSCILFVIVATFSVRLSPLFSSSSSSTSLSRLSEEELRSPTSLKHLVFGLGGSANIWKDRREYTRLWWIPNVTRGFVWLDKDPPLGAPPLQLGISYPPYQVSAKVGLVRDQKPSARLARILKETFELGLPNVRWFVMGDDDTIFFVVNLVAVLSKYDHRQMYYIGGNSEGLEQNRRHGYNTAFGGGGFVVSYALACELVKKLDGCIKTYHNYYGSDERVAACVGELGVPLTKEPGFHQLDIRGDPYGFLAAHPLTPLISLHHLDYIQPLFPGQTQLNSLKTLMQAYHFHPSLILQQSFCNDRKLNRSMSISWGYTVQLYPYLVSSKVLSTPLRTFQTWLGAGSFEFDTRPVSDDACQRPIIYYLDKVKVDQDKNIMSIYKNPEAQNASKCNQTAYMTAMSVKQITATISKTDTGTLTKAMRRHCCDITAGLTKKGNMHLRIGGCQPRKAKNIKVAAVKRVKSTG